MTTEPPEKNESELRAAYDEAFAAATQKPTTVNLANLRRARRELDDFLAGGVDGELVFPSIEKMVAWLDAHGWKSKPSTAYEHIKLGKLEPRDDGRVTQQVAITYAEKHLPKKDGTYGRLGNLSWQEQKIIEEVGIKRADREMRELKIRKERGEVIPMAQVEVEFAERYINLKNYLEAVARASAMQIVKLINGDPQKAPELITFLLAVMRKGLDNYSRPIAGFEDDVEVG